LQVARLLADWYTVMGSKVMMAFVIGFMVERLVAGIMVGTALDMQIPSEGECLG